MKNVWKRTVWLNLMVHLISIFRINFEEMFEIRTVWRNLMVHLISIFSNKSNFSHDVLDCRKISPYRKRHFSKNYGLNINLRGSRMCYVGYLNKINLHSNKCFNFLKVEDFVYLFCQNRHTHTINSKKTIKYGSKNSLCNKK